MKRLNNKGSILIVSLVILYILTSQSVSFSLFDASEINESRRYCNSVSAFWLAEAGANIYMHQPTMLDQGSQTFSYGGGTIRLTKDDSRPMLRLVKSQANYQGILKTIQLTYSANIPEVYMNCLSTKRDITVTGGKTSVIVNDKARISGSIIDNLKHPTVFFEDQQTKVDPSLTSLSDPLVNPQDDDYQQLQEFIKSNRDLVASYPPEEVLYLTGQDTYTINKDIQLDGKRIVYVEGEDKNGNVIIDSNEIVASGQNLTIIATGTVTFNQSGFQAPDSQLNIIAWGGYSETVSAPSINAGIIYTHGVAKFDQITDTSTTNGNVIADGGIEFGEIWSTKVFNYADMTRAESYPPGFEKLTGVSLDPTASLMPHSWREVSI